MSKTIPGASDRVKAFTMDVVMTFIFMFVAFKIIDSAGEVSAITRRVVFLCIVLAYDPLFTSLLGGTIGHRAFNLRIKNASNPEKNIWIPVAIFRFAIKLLLGWISLLTISSNSKGQAIHDMLAGSIVIHHKDTSDDSDDGIDQEIPDDSKESNEIDQLNEIEKTDRLEETL